MKEIFVISDYTNKDGEKKTKWRKVGESWGTNKDGSMNFELYHQPGVRFQMREKEEQKTEEAPF